MGPVGRVVGPNITRGRGGRGDFTDADWVRAIRFGVRRDGTSLVMMPSEVFTNFNNADLMSIVAYTARGAACRSRDAGDEIRRARARADGRRSTEDPDGAEDRASAGDGAGGTDRRCRARAIPGGRQRLSWLSRLRPVGRCRRRSARTAARGESHAGGTRVRQEADFSPRDSRRAPARQAAPSTRSCPGRRAPTMRDDELHALWTYLRSVPPRTAEQKLSRQNDLGSRFLARHQARKRLPRSFCLYPDRLALPRLREAVRHPLRLGRALQVVIEELPHPDLEVLLVLRLPR